MAKLDPYEAFRYQDCRRFMAGRLVAATGRQMESVAVGWQVFKQNNSAWALGMVGLIQAVPIIFLALPAGLQWSRVESEPFLWCFSLHGSGLKFPDYAPSFLPKKNRPKRDRQDEPFLRTNHV
jgi:hypothetical protein